MAPIRHIVDHRAAGLVRSPRKVALPPGGVVVFESRHAPGFVGELSDDYAKFLLVVAGRASWEGAGREHLLGPGMLVHVAAGAPHRQRDLPDLPVTLYAIHYRPALLPPAIYQRLSAADMLRIVIGGQSGAGTEQAQAMFQEMLFEQDARTPGWEAILHARLLDIAAIVVRRSALTDASTGEAIEPDGLARVAAYVGRLDASFFKPANLAAAAEEVRLSRRQFTELFRKLTGESWSRRLLRLRLEHAARLLGAAGRSVTAVAFESGFEDLSHFHHAFRKAYGCAPGEYRSRPGSQSRAPAAPSAPRRRL